MWTNHRLTKNKTNMHCPWDYIRQEKSFNNAIAMTFGQITFVSSKKQTTKSCIDPIFVFSYFQL